MPEKTFASESTDPSHGETPRRFFLRFCALIVRSLCDEFLLARLEGELFPRYGMTVFESEVRVTR